MDISIPETVQSICGIANNKCQVVKELGFATLSATTYYNCRYMPEKKLRYTNYTTY